MASFYLDIIKEAKRNGILFYSSRALIIEDEKILLLKKIRSKYNGGKLELPGGKKRKNENIIKTLRRETLEETGRNIISEKYIGYFDIEYKGRKIREYVFLTNTDRNEIKINKKEHDSFLWIRKEELKNYDIIDESRGFLLSYLSHL